MSNNPCGWCNGNGVFYGDNGPSPREEICEVCEGTGVFDLEIAYPDPLEDTDKNMSPADYWRVGAGEKTCS